MIDQATKERILDAVRIEEVVGDFVSLRKKGANYWGICPFHQDKNPSMSVSPTRGIFKCFSCGKAGNAVTFVMEHEHKSYAEALKYLADKYHIEVREREETPEEIAGRMKYESLLIVSEYAQKFYQDVLWNDPKGRAIGLSYFRERKFTDDTIRKFGLGYAPAREPSLCVDAIRKGYKREYLVESGLAVERENGDLADRFYDRVMFPIHSLSGRVIAFGGRTLRTDKSVAKYVNSAQTEIYDKSHSLYGIFQAKSAIGKADKCILVEGYADVISMHQSGIENVVASSGTSLTEGQIRLIKRFTSNITLMYDGDEAGIHAALRGTDLILQEGMYVKVVLLPPEDDPDSYAKAHTTAEINEYIEEHECDFIAFKSDVLAKDMEHDPIRKARLVNEIIQTVSVIPDPILRSTYVETVASRFNQKEDDILQKIDELREKRRRLERLRSQDRPAQGTFGAAPQDAGGFSPEDEYVPADGTGQDYPEYDPLGIPDAEGKSSANPYLLTNPYFATQEREIVYYLLKFGRYPLFTPYPEERATMIVEQFVSLSLSDDGITLSNRLYRELYEDYFKFAETLPECTPDTPLEEIRRQQEEITAHFSRCETPALLQEVLNLLLEKHQLTVKLYIESLEPEQQRLGEIVPKAVGIYKLRIIEQMCRDVTRQINDAQHSSDAELQKQLVQQLQNLNKAKLAISKELNRL